MSKIVKNTTALSYSITDVGVTIPALDSYTIPPQDYFLWAASSDVITGIGSGDLVINDGSLDLSIADGTALILGLFPKSIRITEDGAANAEVKGIGVSGSETGLVVRPIPSAIPQPVTIVTSGLLGEEVKSLFNEELSVATNAVQTLINHTVPPEKLNYLLRIDVSGSNIATYDIMINGTQFARVRTFFGGKYSETVNIASSKDGAIKLSPGDNLQVQVTNFRPTVGDFEARVQYIEAD